MRARGISLFLITSVLSCFPTAVYAQDYVQDVEIENETTVYVKLWDNGTVDGDIVRARINGVTLGGFTLTAAGVNLGVTLNFGVNPLEIIPLNEGSISPNTCSIEITSEAGAVLWSGATDGYVGDTLTVNLNVKIVLKATPQSGLTIDECKPLEIQLAGTAPDGVPITKYFITGKPSKGKILHFDSVTGKLTYQPTIGAVGSDSFGGWPVAVGAKEQAAGCLLLAVACGL